MIKNIYNVFFDSEIWKLVNQDNKDLLDDFLMELKQNKKSSGTISQYKADIKGIYCHIYKNLENKSILELNKRDFRTYSLWLTENCKISSARHNRLLSSLRSLLTFAENEDQYEYLVNTASKVKGLSKESVREIIFLTDEQIMKLKNKLIELKEYQSATLLMLAYDSAGRRGELSQVQKYSFLDNENSNTNQVVGKRRKKFSLFYFSGTKECAKLWLQQRGNDTIDSLWVMGRSDNKYSVTREMLYDWFLRIRDLLTEIEDKETKFGSHSIRHSALQNMNNGTHYVCRELGMNSGFPIEKLRLYANHESVDTTQGYLKDNSLDELESMFKIKINNI